MSQSETLEIEVVVAEDFSAQIYWTDEEGNPMPVSTPCRLEARDMNGNLVIQFDSGSFDDADTKATMTVTGSDGILQLSAPRTVTVDLLPGRYLFDLFAVTPNAVAPFPAQEVQVCNGWFIVSPRVTKMEEAAL